MYEEHGYLDITDGPGCPDDIVDIQVDDYPAPLDHSYGGPPEVAPPEEGLGGLAWNLLWITCKTSTL